MFGATESGGTGDRALVRLPTHAMGRSEQASLPKTGAESSSANAAPPAASADLAAEGGWRPMSASAAVGVDSGRAPVRLLVQPLRVVDCVSSQGGGRAAEIGSAASAAVAAAEAACRWRPMFGVAEFGKIDGCPPACSFPSAPGCTSPVHLSAPFGVGTEVAPAFLEGGLPILTLGFSRGAACKAGHSFSSNAAAGSPTRVSAALSVADRVVGA